MYKIYANRERDKPHAKCPAAHPRPLARPQFCVSNKHTHKAYRYKSRPYIARARARRTSRRRRQHRAHRDFHPLCGIADRTCSSGSQFTQIAPLQARARDQRTAPACTQQIATTMYHNKTAIRHTYYVDLARLLSVLL